MKERFIYEFKFISLNVLDVLIMIVYFLLSITIVIPWLLYVLFNIDLIIYTFYAEDLIKEL